MPLALTSRHAWVVIGRTPTAGLVTAVVAMPGVLPPAEAAQQAVGQAAWAVFLQHHPAAEEVLVIPSAGIRQIIDQVDQQLRNGQAAPDAGLPTYFG